MRRRTSSAIVTLAFTLGRGVLAQPAAPDSAPPAPPQPTAPPVVAPGPPAPATTPPPPPGPPGPPPPQAYGPPPAPGPGGYPPSYPPPGPPGPPGYAPPFPQPPPPDPTVERHDGFYFRVSVGGARMVSTLDVDRPIANETTLTGGALSLDLAFGGTPADGFVIGGAIFTDTFFSPRSDDLVPSEEARFDSYGVSLLGPFASLYPDARDGLHFVGAFGLGNVSSGNACIDDRCGDGGTNVLRDQVSVGFGMLLGVGYDFWIGEQWSLGVLARGQYVSASGETKDEEEVRATALVLPSVQLAFTHH